MVQPILWVRLSSIVFQEIRESKALAYSAYVHASNPPKKNKAHWLQGYVGTQPDKLRDAVEAFQAILEDMPVSLPQIETARQSVLKQIAASRITRSELFWTWRGNRDKGFPKPICGKTFTAPWKKPKRMI
jgi:zinc protease